MFQGIRPHLFGQRCDNTFIQSGMNLSLFLVVNDARRPMVQMEYKGESRSFYPEEVSKDVRPIAGLSILRSIKEPLTAAIVYGLNKILSKLVLILSKERLTSTLPLSVPV
ncbi:hypothetical protein HPG69_007842 [Diceros bicornis minor]|uniref:Uncharacterized protein n=1 Tax=Diceros bicornis minor TaxID=77932 RepID=A0A7J7EAT6_DICBM|nr:hypothetical protein HPG69_007842 [Diceros bicornis minor]